MSEHIEYEARTVRPYAVTGGRVRSARSDLPLERWSRPCRVP